MDEMTRSCERLRARLLLVAEAEAELEPGCAESVA